MAGRHCSIDDGRIVAVGAAVTAANAGAGAEVADCRGLTLMPGLIDMRVFTGEPGNEHRETLAIGIGSRRSRRRFHDDRDAQHRSGHR